MVEIPLTVARRRGVYIPEGADFALRPKITSLGDCNAADVSISHDGDYATAVVMAAQELENSLEKAIVDTGEGDPIHVPSLDDDPKAMHNRQLRELVRRQTLAPLAVPAFRTGSSVDEEVRDEYVIPLLCCH